MNTAVPALSRGVVVASIFTLGACTGSIQDEGHDANEGGSKGRDNASGGTGGGDDETGGTRAAACKPQARGAARESVRRLSRDELRATLADLMPVGDRLDQDIAAFPDTARDTSFDLFEPRHDAGQIERWLTVSEKVGSVVAEDANVRAAVSGADCLDESAVTPDCWTTVVRDFLPRVFRRPVSDEEIDLYAAYVVEAAGNDRAEGLTHLTMRTLMAPDFLFHIETGVADAKDDEERIRLTEHEVANRIAYGVTGSMPDAKLRTAAEEGRLGDLDQVESQVRRLLSDPRADAQIRDFFGDWTNVNETSTPDSTLYDKWARLPGTAAQAGEDMRHDVEAYLDRVVLQDRGTFADLMTRKASYIDSASLAAIYRPGDTGVAPGADGYETPDHPGLPLRAVFLTGPGLNTHPINRGVRFLRRILCEELPTPDPVLLAMRDDVPVDPLMQANHELTDAMTGAPICQTCHAKINPIGFLLEAYDNLGRRRTEESYLEPDGEGVAVAATHALPGPQTPAVEGFDDTLEGPGDLATALGSSPRANACMSTFLIRHFQKRLESEADQCAIGEVAKVLREGASLIDAFVVSVANEDIFWRTK